MFQKDKETNEITEYTTVDLDGMITCLHKKIIRRYGKLYIDLLQKVDNRGEEDGEELVFDRTDTRPNDKGKLSSVCLQSHHFNQESYNVNQILSHTGPLKAGQDGYKGSRYNVTIDWLYGKSLVKQEVSLNELAKQVPKMIAQYAIKYNLTNEKGWKMPEVQSHVRKIQNKNTE
jgi:hypothetical protein